MEYNYLESKVRPIIYNVMHGTTQNKSHDEHINASTPYNTNPPS